MMCAHFHHLYYFSYYYYTDYIYNTYQHVPVELIAYSVGNIHVHVIVYYDRNRQINVQKCAIVKMLKKYALFPCVTILILIVILILCECQVGMGKKKKRNVNIVSILDHRIQKIMKFCQQLVKDDGNLFDGIQLLQTVYDQINLPYFDQLKLKHRYALQKRLNEYKYQNKSFYILMKQTVCNFLFL